MWVLNVVFFPACNKMSMALCPFKLLPDVFNRCNRPGQLRNQISGSCFQNRSQLRRWWEACWTAEHRIPKLSSPALSVSGADKGKQSKSKEKNKSSSNVYVGYSPDTRHIVQRCNVCSRASAPPRRCLWSAVRIRGCRWRCAARQPSWGSDTWRSAWLWHSAASGRSTGQCGLKRLLTRSRKTGAPRSQFFFFLKSSQEVHRKINTAVNMSILTVKDSRLLGF